jgi:hypothetical protein
VSNGHESCNKFLQTAHVTAVTCDTPGQTRVCQCAVSSDVASVRERLTGTSEPVEYWYHVRFHIMQNALFLKSKMCIFVFWVTYCDHGVVEADHVNATAGTSCTICARVYYSYANCGCVCGSVCVWWGVLADARQAKLRERGRHCKRRTVP